MIVYGSFVGRRAAVLMLGLGLTVGPARLAVANEFAAPLKRFVEEQLRPWLKDAALVEAIKAQNAKHAGLSQADIDQLDKTWRAEAKKKGGPLVDEVQGRPLSAFLKGKKDSSDGLIDEMFVMDNRGLNVGQSDVTSDYWQGDEPKWQKTYPAGAGGIFVDEVEFDESTKSYQAQVSATVVDPASGTAIGAITVGVNVEKLPE